MSYPILELEDGTWLGEHVAICKYLLALGGKKDLLGKNAFEAASIEQWGFYILTSLNKHWLGVLYPCFGFNEDKAAWEATLAAWSKELPHLEASVSGGWLVGDDFSLADILLWRIAFILFSFCLGPDQRAKLPNLTAWYEKMSAHPLVVSTAGKYHMTAQPWQLFGSAAVITLAADAPKEEAKEAAADEEDIDEDDLFGDDDDDDDDQDARMAMKAKAHEAKFGKRKEKVIVNKSMIIFEVKPADIEVDLDALHAKILAEITQDGLLWKTEYNKDPVAFGIFKLILGATVEDEKVSADDLIEKMEAWEDLVQSVDIAAFNKV